MDKNKTEKKRRIPGESAKKKPQKAPPLRPRKHAPVREPERTTPEVVYQAPKPFSRNRLILRLATVAAVVVALLLGLSIFFKVEKVEVSGCDKYTAYQVQQASGIEPGEQLLTFSRARAASKILADLPYIRSVRIGIRLPDTVTIEIVESTVGYAVEDHSGSWWLMDCQGKILEQVDTPDGHPTISGVKLASPEVGMQAAAYEDGQESTDEAGNVIPVTVTASKRLSTAVSIVENLERNGIYGEVVSLDVTNIHDIILWYHDAYRILLGHADNVSYNVALLKAAVDACSQNYPDVDGQIDISDTGYYAFQAFTE